MSAAEHDREAICLYELASSRRFRFLFGDKGVRMVMDEASRHRNSAHAMRALGSMRKASSSK